MKGGIVKNAESHHSRALKNSELPPSCCNDCLWSILVYSLLLLFNSC